MRSGAPFQQHLSSTSLKTQHFGLQRHLVSTKISEYKGNLRLSPNGYAIRVGHQAWVWSHITSQINTRTWKVEVESALSDVLHTNIEFIWIDCEWMYCDATPRDHGGLENHPLRFERLYKSVSCVVWFAGVRDTAHLMLNAEARNNMLQGSCIYSFSFLLLTLAYSFHDSAPKSTVSCSPWIAGACPADWQPKAEQIRRVSWQSHPFWSKQSNTWSTSYLKQLSASQKCSLPRPWKTGWGFGTASWSARHIRSTEFDLEGAPTAVALRSWIPPSITAHWKGQNDSKCTKAQGALILRNFSWLATYMIDMLMRQRSSTWKLISASWCNSAHLKIL